MKWREQYILQYVDTGDIKAREARTEYVSAFEVS